VVWIHRFFVLFRLLAGRSAHRKPEPLARGLSEDAGVRWMKEIWGATEKQRSRRAEGMG